VSDQPDDLDAVRTVVDAIVKFDAGTQERVLRWVREKIGLPTTDGMKPNLGRGTDETSAAREPSKLLPASIVESQHKHGTDIKSFVTMKGPSSNNEFAATVAYYYRFEAPEADRKESISSTDLQEACRLAGRARLTDPSQTLFNAHQAGLIDKTSDRGLYRISTVGENLVAMTLPATGSSATGNRRPPTVKKSSKKTVPTKKRTKRK
jgi:hypothetical protein